MNTNDLPLALVPKNPTSPSPFSSLPLPGVSKEPALSPKPASSSPPQPFPDCGLFAGAAFFVERKTCTGGGAEAFANCWTFFSILEES